MIKKELSHKTKKSIILALSILTIISIFLTTITVNSKDNEYPLGVSSNFNLFVFNNAKVKSGKIQGKVAVGDSLQFQNGSSVGMNSDKSIDLYVGKNLDIKQSGLNGKYILGEDSATKTNLVAAEYQLANRVTDQYVVDNLHFKNNKINSFNDAQQQLIKISNKYADNKHLTQGRVSKGQHDYEPLILKHDGSAINNTIYFNVDAQMMSRSQQIDIDVKEDLYIVINVIGESVTLPSWGMVYKNKKIENYASKILFNFSDAKEINKRSTNLYGTILAPLANFEDAIAGGNHYGSIIVNNFDSNVVLFEEHCMVKPPQTAKKRNDYLVNLNWNGGPTNKPSIKVQLYQNNKAYLEPITIDSLSYTFRDLEVSDDEGNEYNYTIKQINKLDDYETSVSGFTITNTYIEKLIDIKGNISWVDKQVSTRPTKYFILLYANDKEVSRKEVDNSETSYIFKDIKKLDNNYNEVDHKIEVTNLLNYQTSIDNFDIEHVYVAPPKEKRNINVLLEWVDAPTNKPSIKVQLYQNNKAYLEPITIDSLSYTFRDLEVSDDEGNEYNYTIKQINKLDDYETSVSGFTITNTYIEKLIDIKGNITWQEKTYYIRPQSYIVSLFNENGKVAELSITPDKINYIFKNQLLKDKDGSLFNYYITVSGFINYESIVDGFNIYHKNNYVVKASPIHIQGTITWIDRDKRTRPNDIIVELYRNENLLKRKTISSDDTSYNFENLEKNDSDNRQYDYSIKVFSIKNYETNVEGFNITNTEIIKQSDMTMNISGEVIWRDHNNKYFTRPESVFIELKVNDKIKSIKEYQISEYTYSFTGLPILDEKLVPYNYSISASKIDGYTMSIEENNIIYKLDSYQDNIIVENDGSTTNNETDSSSEDLLDKNELPKTGDNTLSIIVGLLGIAFVFRRLKLNI